MKKKQLVKEIKRYGWWFYRQGGNHEIWTDGVECVSVPRHKEVKEYTAEDILKKLRQINMSKKQKG